MSRHLLTVFALLLCAFASFSTAQTYQPKTIQFKGDPEYTAAELLAVSGLKNGVAYTVAQMNEHTKLLMDSGVFQDISFTFNGQDLVYQIIPATVMFPPRLENLTLPQGKELDDKLRARFPLYHGKIPTEGSLLDDIRKEFEDELKAKGIQATILAAPYTDLKLGKITAIGFTITNPEMRVGEIQLRRCLRRKSNQSSLGRCQGDWFNLQRRRQHK
jgi:outer membrane protein assembly factor BamA